MQGAGPQVVLQGCRERRMNSPVSEGTFLDFRFHAASCLAGPVPQPSNTGHDLPAKKPLPPKRLSLLGVLLRRSGSHSDQAERPFSRPCSPRTSIE